MDTIELTRGRETIVDAEDHDWLNQWSWYCDAYGYAVRDEGGKHIYMAREIADTPDGMIADHINGDTLDNRRCNLRNVTKAQNGQNCRPTTEYGGRPTTSDYKGVSWDKARQMWRAYIFVDGKHVHLGRFDGEAEAARTYNRAARKHFGEYARPNEVAT